MKYVFGLLLIASGAFAGTWNCTSEAAGGGNYLLVFDKKLERNLVLSTGRSGWKVLSSRASVETDVSNDPMDPSAQNVTGYSVKGKGFESNLYSNLFDGDDGKQSKRLRGWGTFPAKKTYVE